MCIDLSAAYLAGVTKHLPKATVSFDAFHVIQLANQAVDTVRREEVKTEPALRGTRWTWLKDAHDWTWEQLTDFHWLSRARLQTARAWRLKEALRDIYATASTLEQAESALGRWYSWARRSRLQPMKHLAATLKDHWDGVLAAFDSGLTNGRAEGINSLIQAPKARARGYRTTRSLITIAYLIAGNLAHLPASPFNTRSLCQTSGRGCRSVSISTHTIPVRTKNSGISKNGIDVRSFASGSKPITEPARKGTAAFVQVAGENPTAAPSPSPWAGSASIGHSNPVPRVLRTSRRVLTGPRPRTTLPAAPEAVEFPVLPLDVERPDILAGERFGPGASLVASCWAPHTHTLSGNACKGW